MLHITSDITIHVKWYYKSRQRCYIPRQVFQYMSSGIISHVKGVTCHVRYFNHVKWYYKSRQRCYISRQIFQYMSSGIISHVKGVTYHVRYYNTCQVVLQVTSEVLHVTPDITIHVIWYYKSRQRCYMSRQIFQYMSSGIISHVKGVTYHVRCYNTCQVVL